jgi:hypothetical protein
MKSGIKNIESSQDLFIHARTMHRTFLKFGTYWSVEHCLESIIEKRNITNSTWLTESRILAKAEDKRFERIFN